MILTFACWQVALFAIVMGLLGLIFFYIGISMGWLYVSIFFWFISEVIGSFPLPDIHGSHLGKCSRSDCIGNHMEEGQQMGMYRRIHCRVYRWYRRMAGDNRYPQPQRYQCHGELRHFSLLRWPIPMPSFDFRPAVETMKCLPVILQQSVSEESLPPHLLTS